MSRASLSSMVFASLLGLVIISTAFVSGTSAAKCVDEFASCETTRDCCGRRNSGSLKVQCVMGTQNQTAAGVGMTCKSTRSQVLDELSGKNDIDLPSLQFLLEKYIYSHPAIKEQHEEKLGDEELHPDFFLNIAKKYEINFAELVVSLERSYRIKDLTILPILIRDFLSWRDMVDIKGVFDGDYDEEGEVAVGSNFKKGAGRDDPEEKLSGENENIVREDSL